MESKKQMSRKVYKRTLGLTFLLSLILLDLAYLLPTIHLDSNGVWHLPYTFGIRLIVIPVSTLWLASGITLLVWAFLRLAVPLEPLNEEERSRPLLQRLSFLQLFAGTGTLVGIMWGVSVFLVAPFLEDEPKSAEWVVLSLFTLHFVLAALAATWLYIGAHAKHILVLLLCFILFLATLIANLFGTMLIADQHYGQLDNTYTEDTEPIREAAPYEDFSPSEYPDEPEEEDDTEWIGLVGHSIVHYCNEYGGNTASDFSISFIDRILYDFLDIQNTEFPDERWQSGHQWLNPDDFRYLQQLIHLILESDPEDEEYIYETLCNVVLPVIESEMDHKNLYPYSDMASLMNLLDYAYHDLRSDEDEKLDALFDDMTTSTPTNTYDLISYFNYPHAMATFPDNQVIWAYSFWARRWKDNHINLCRRLLDKILEIYPNTAYTTETMAASEQASLDNCLKMVNVSKESILAEIKETFANVPRPAKEELTTNWMEDPKEAERIEKFSPYAWTEVPAQLLHSEADILDAFTPEGLLYYFPAFLSEIVDHYDAEAYINHPVLRTLVYDRISGLSIQQRDRFYIFSSAQGATIRRVLMWMEANHGKDFLDEPDSKTSKWWEAINSWWIRY